ncbi:MAG: hypothetical protein BGO48_11890 [Mucilaginibacter sp. 44-25]|nr:MAG: hypothetical protein BGO48_11890 [Mucilaginibacter sp. 44-25]
MPLDHTFFATRKEGAEKVVNSLPSLRSREGRPAGDEVGVSQQKSTHPVIATARLPPFASRKEGSTKII